ncbi:SRPBCC family protein [Hamadaea tsunoensis]|uniref:SRPBCC family protein n=1 Tax=Hamadaea tsunoensis TaxID=53368 RepID=UPI000426C2BE|nr:SRPBCC domain-containing protein [Hamadaea tsunoensis]
MTHPFEVTGEITVDATPDQVWDAITTGPGVDSWLMGRTEIDGEGRTATFEMFGDKATSAITAWEPGHRYATQGDKNPDGTFMAFEWLIEARDGGGAVVRFVHSGLLGDDWEAEYNGLSVGDQAYLTKLAVYVEHFAPRTAKLSTFLPGPVTADSWAAMTAAVGAGTDAADGQPARLTVAGIEPVDGVVEFVHAPSFVGMRTADAMYTLVHGYNDMMFATAHYFDDSDRTAETEAWQAWLGTLAAPTDAA